MEVRLNRMQCNMSVLNNRGKLLIFSENFEIVNFMFSHFRAFVINRFNFKSVQLENERDASEELTQRAGCHIFAPLANPFDKLPEFTSFSFEKIYRCIWIRPSEDRTHH